MPNLTEDSAAEPVSVARHRRTRRLVIATGIVLVALFAAVLWVGIRGMMARDELLGAMPLARSVADAAMSGDASTVESDAAELTRRAASAHSLTSDPIWRAAELVPGIGKNLTAFSEAAEAVHHVADEALPPLMQLAGTVSVESFTPKSGNFDLEAIETAAPLLAAASSALEQSDADVQAIDTAGTVEPLETAVEDLRGLLSEASTAVGGLDSAARLLPPMLGADGPRSYLIMSLTNAELRASGGIPGAFVLITAENGRLGLGNVALTDDIGQFQEPVLPLTDAESVLYEQILGQYPQNVTLTPDFARSGELVRAMWKERMGGGEVDGVISIDPVVLGYILDATGPIDSGSVMLDSGNTADVLLSSVYAMFEQPKEQDKFFVRVTGQVFAKLMGGDASGSALFEALARGSDEQRLHVWSAHDEEQQIIAGTPLAGTMPESTADATAIGVYFNDATAAKMDYYLQGRIDVASAMCRSDGRPVFSVGVTLTSTAPADAASVLPSYVLGDGRSGALGEFSTITYVYAPAGAEFFSVTVDGQELSFTRATHDGRSVAGIQTRLIPSQTALLQLSFLAQPGASTAVELVHTPMFQPVLTSVDNVLDCGRVEPAPTDGPNDGTTGALAPGIAVLTPEN